MSPRIFLDTNILLDLLLERSGYQAASVILQAGADGKATLYTSVLSMANIAYILRKKLSPGILTPTLLQIASLVNVLPMDEKLFREAVIRLACRRLAFHHCHPILDIVQFND